MELKNWLEQYPSSEEFSRLYQIWREELPPLKDYPFPSRLIEFLQHCKPGQFRIRNGILHALISKFLLGEESPVLSVYLFILLQKPFLEMPLRYWKKRLKNYHVSDEELWNELWIGFYKTLKEYDLNARDRIGLYFQGKVSNSIGKSYHNKIKEWDSEISFNEEMDTSVPATYGKKRSREKTVFSAGEIGEMTLLLERLVSENVIIPAEKDIIVENVFHEVAAETIAHRMNVSYQSLKKRIYRIKVRIADALKET